MKKGFTLAEVLITLAIIGVVAAITIPSVVVNTQQNEFKTGLRKAVSVLNSAIQANIITEGETPYDNSSLGEYLMRHMSVTKTKNINTCIDSSGKALNISNASDYNKGCPNLGADTQYNIAFYTTDGMRFETGWTTGDSNKNGLRLHESDESLRTPKTGLYQYSWGTFYGTSTNGFCGSYGLAQNPNETKNTPCIIMVDVNGDKKPNPPQAYNDNRYDYSGTANQIFTYSYPSPNSKRFSDIFGIMITDEKAIPFGVVAQRAMYGEK